MAFRTLSRSLPFFLLLLHCLSAATAKVYYLPMNVRDGSEYIDGLVFYFEASTASTATITVDAVKDGKPISSTQVIDTDRIHGSHLFFSLLIDPDSRQKLTRVQIEMGGLRWVLDHPEAATEYSLDQPTTSKRH